MCGTSQHSNLPSLRSVFWPWRFRLPTSSALCFTLLTFYICFTCILHFLEFMVVLGDFGELNIKKGKKGKLQNMVKLQLWDMEMEKWKWKNRSLVSALPALTTSDLGSVAGAHLGDGDRWEISWSPRGGQRANPSDRSRRRSWPGGPWQVGWGSNTQKDQNLNTK